MQSELTPSETEMLSFDSADDRIAAYLQRHVAVAHDDEAQERELTPSEMEMLMLDDVDDRIAAYKRQRMTAAEITTAADNDQTKSEDDVVGEGDQALPPAPTYDGPRKVVCREIPCRLVWELKSIEGTVYVLSRPNARDYTVCASCYEAYKHMYPPDAVFVSKPASEYPPLVETSRQRLEAYQRTLHLWRTDGPWIFGMLALSPIAIPTLVLLSAFGASPASLHWALGRPLALWRSLNKMHMLIFGVYLTIVVALLVLTSPFRSQILFWTLLEIYTLVTFVISLMNTSAHKTSPLVVLLGLSPALGEMQNLLNSATYAFVVAFAAEAKSIDVTKLKFVAKDGTPVPPSQVAAAFEAARVWNHVRKRLRTPVSCVAKFIGFVLAYNEFFVASWATGALPVTVFAYGINGLVSSPNQTMYNVTFTNPTCTNSSVTTSDVLINLFVAPPPTGNPLITFGFSSNGSDSRFNTSFDVVASWNIDIKRAHARNITIGLFDDQAALTFRARFPLACSDLQNLSMDWVLEFESVSLSSLTTYVVNKAETLIGLGLFQLFLAVKYLVQLMWITGVLASSSVNIWSLWLRFDTITDIGIDLPGKGPTAIALTDGENLHAWFTLRNGVRAATSMYTYLLSGFICGALLQFACMVAGILVYCISGSAPLPTYFLLLIGLLGSLSTLAMLVPLAAALEIQRKHNVMLRKHLLELEFLRRKALLQGNETALDERIASFETAIDAIEHHDDRLTCFGIEISQGRLATLGATLASVLSFVAFRAVPITWSSLNSYNIMSVDEYKKALNPLFNTPQLIEALRSQ